MDFLACILRGALRLGLALAAMLGTQDGLLGTQAGRDWPARWADLERLAAQEDSLLRDNLCEEQRALARALPADADPASRFRVGLLGAALEQPLSDWGTRGLPAGLEAAEIKRATGLLPAGLARAEAWIFSLRAPSEDAEELHELQRGAFEAFLAEHDAFHIPAATQLAEALYVSGPALWSAYCVEGISRRAGNSTRSFEVLDQQLAATAEDSILERVDLAQRRAIAAAGAGQDDLVRASLGRALQLGGDDALQILGKSALENRQPGRARLLFRALLSRAEANRTEPAPWALRGWGLSLLPAIQQP